MQACKSDLSLAESSRETTMLLTSNVDSRSIEEIYMSCKQKIVYMFSLVKGSKCFSPIKEHSSITLM